MRGGDAEGAERIDLIFHEGDERGDDDGGAFAELGEVECGGLVAERFSAAGGEDDERVAAIEHGLHGGLLQRAERGVAPGFLDEGEEGSEVVGGLGGHGWDCIVTKRETRNMKRKTVGAEK